MSDACNNISGICKQFSASPAENDAAEEALLQMKLAVLCGRLNCELAGSDIWSRIPAEGDCPTPAELIAWAAAETVRRMKSRA